jgi:YggT family protein
MSPGANALSFLLNTIFDLYVMIVALRFLMQMVRADYYNPIAQFIVKATNPILVPLRRVIPGMFGQDMAALLLCLGLLLIKFFLFAALDLGSVSIAGTGLMLSGAPALTLVFLAVIDLLALFFNIFFFAIIILAILSWVSPGGYNPAAALLDAIAAPVLGPVRRVVPPIGGLDLSPLVALVGLQVLKILIIQSLLGLLL